MINFGFAFLYIFLIGFLPLIFVTIKTISLEKIKNKTQATPILDYYSLSPFGKACLVSKAILRIVYQKFENILFQAQRFLEDYMHTQKQKIRQSPYLPNKFYKFYYD